jgi:predicted transcriptional regulator
MSISGLALKLLIYIVLEEHEVTLQKLHAKFYEPNYDVTKALEELINEEMVVRQKINEDLGHYWVYGATVTGRSFARFLGEELRDVYVH